jgi:hypothetical protein
MELALNSLWVLVAAASVCLWFRLGRRLPADRRISFIALVMLIFVLFPVISVSDDLWSIQNPAETDTYQRRDHLTNSPHSIFPVLAALPEPAIAELSFSFQRLSAPLNLPLPAIKNPALNPIQNRPPPAA